MDRVYVPLMQFYETCLPAAKYSGYKYVMCLLARETGIDSLYRMLKQQWVALDDITGEDFLFVFTGKYNSDDSISEVVCDSFVIRNKYSYIMNREPSLRLKTTYDFRKRSERGKWGSDIPSSHTQNVSELRAMFNLSERDVPCLVYTNLHNKKNIVVPFSGTNLYNYFRCLYISIEENIHEINTLYAKIAECNKVISKLPTGTIEIWKELYNVANTLSSKEREYLYECMNNLSQTQPEEKRRTMLSREVRIKLGRYIDSMRKVSNLDSIMISRITHNIELQYPYKQLDTVFAKIDEKIRLSASYVKAQPVANNPYITMQQKSENSVQIGMVAAGGVVNLFDTRWITIIMQRLFLLLEDFLSCISGILETVTNGHSTYLLSNKAREIIEFYGRHEKYLFDFSEKIQLFENLGIKYNTAYWTLNNLQYCKDNNIEICNAKDKAITAFTQCIKDYKELASDMLKFNFDEQIIRRN